MGCSSNKYAFLGEYNLYCIDFDIYNLKVKRNRSFIYTYNGELLHSTKNGNWKLMGDTLFLITNKEVFKKFKYKNEILCEIVGQEEDTVFCKYCYKRLK
ncbi:MAG: hypothetical protein CFE21_01065 [Bacteroidetes bacterium B1(2017)]|nr:MAG: hypothetical protein CFE21_01065 [Bacteroidetes bacterium B1(2017)]